MSIPVGTVCRIIDNGVTYAEYVGLECTVVEGLAKRKSSCKDGTTIEAEVYVVHVQGYGTKPFNTPPDTLQPKRFPDQLQGWLSSKVQAILQPNHVIALELALETTREGGQ